MNLDTRVLSLLLTAGFACTTSVAWGEPPPIGLDELDLIVHREATSYDEYKKLPQLSSQARKVLIFEPGVVQVMAPPTQTWQYRGSARSLIQAQVEKDDYSAL